jgi:tRNA uridine 5-carboxymethylaminomethyl modification enzyme
MDNVKEKISKVEEVKALLNNVFVEPGSINAFLEEQDSAKLVNKQRALQVLLRPNISLQSMKNADSNLGKLLQPFDNETLEQVEIQVKYETYIEKEKELVAKMSQLEDLVIPDNFNYVQLSSLSNEARQKFTKIRPRTLGQASRISGVNPSDVQILMVFMGR